MFLCDLFPVIIGFGFFQSLIYFFYSFFECDTSVHPISIKFSDLSADDQLIDDLLLHCLIQIIESLKHFIL